MHLSPLPAGNRSMQTAAGIFHSEKTGLMCPPIVAVEHCRECLIESEEDILWKADRRKTSEEIADRGFKFLNWLWNREEREIAVVTHSKFLVYTLTDLANHSHPSLTTEIRKKFQNCELRSLVMIDKGVENSNYPQQKIILEIFKYTNQTPHPSLKQMLHDQLPRA